jgi:putative two-component system response regulator
MTESNYLAQTRKRILIVDDQAANLSVMRQILKDDYDLSFAKSGEDALSTMTKVTPDLVLLDVMMPGMDGYSVRQHMTENPALSGIPVIFCTAMSDANDEARGLALGAVDYITKPVVPAIVKLRVRNQLALADQRWDLARQVREANKSLLESRLHTLQILGRAAEFKDNETGLHVIRMSHYSRLIAESVGWDEDACDLLFNAAPMHDIGKIGTPDAILTKPGRLDDEERVIMNEHARIGAEIIGDQASSSPLLKMAQRIALAHHEKWDGSGYPEGLAGEDIPIEARIVAIADVFDALTSKRPYKEAWPVDKALALIKEESGRHFDPGLVALFLTQLDRVEVIRQQWAERG